MRTESPRPADRVDEADRAQAAARALTVFSFLWAGAALFHRAQYSRWSGSPIELAESFCALLVLLRPSWLPGFLSLVTFQFVQNSILMPRISNHTILVWFMSGTILLATVLWLREGRRVRGELYRTFAPALRIELLVLYFYVVFQKLNPDFLDLDGSCAVTLLDKLALRLDLPLNPVWARGPAVYGTLLIEAAIPALLVLRTTRSYGIVLGMGFHFSVALANFYDFSSLLFACYYLFAPENHADLLADWWRRASRTAPGAALRRIVATSAWRAGVLPALLVVAVLVASGDDWRTAPRLAWTLWWFYGLGAMLLYLLPLLGGASPVHRGVREVFATRPLLLVGPLLVVLNGMSPHLGFKTENSFAMFSNLRTEGGINNHFLVSPNVQIFDYQRDLVRILSSSEPFLENRARFSGFVPYATLRTHVSELASRGRRNIRVSYVRAGQRYDLAQAERDPELSAPYPLPLRKLLWFREIVNDRTRALCRH